MALFGGIGKALGLGTSQGRGFITGLASKVSEEIDADVKATEDRVSRLGDLRLERVSRNAERYQTENRENTDIITNMVKKLEGDTDAVQYLINEYGFVGAQEQVETLNELRQIDGETLSHTKLLDIQRKNGNPSTISNIAKQVTRPITDLDLSKTDPRVGFQRLFGTKEKSVAELARRSDDDIAAAGYGDLMKTSTQDDRAEIQGRRIYPWLNRLSGNPVQDNYTMGAIANKLVIRHENAEGADKEAIFQEMHVAKTLAADAQLKLKLAEGIGKPLTTAQVKSYNDITMKLLLPMYSKVTSGDFTISGEFIGAGRSLQQTEALQDAASVIGVVASEAQKSNVDPAIWQSDIQKIIRKKEIPTWNSETQQVESTGQVLIDVTQRMKNGDLVFPSFAIEPVEPEAGLGNVAGTTDNQRLANLIDAYRRATNTKERKTLRSLMLNQVHDGKPLTIEDIDLIAPLPSR